MSSDPAAPQVVGELWPVPVQGGVSGLLGPQWQTYTQTVAATGCPDARCPGSCVASGSRSLSEGCQQLRVAVWKLLERPG